MKFYLNGNQISFNEAEVIYGFRKLDYMVQETYKLRRNVAQPYDTLWQALEGGDTLKIEIA